jgi:peptide/nickel transport system ATP-binding protein
MSGTGEILKVRNLSAELLSGNRQLIRGISFHIHEGEILGLVGQSGCGKSLTSLAITGLLPQGIRASGSVQLDGQEIIGAGEKALNKIRGRDAAIIFQEPASALDPLMKIGRQIALPLRKYTGLGGIKLRQAVYSLMEEVHLSDISRIARSLPHEISGGQRQRAAIALALACSPKLLIADEPTSSMDAAIQKQLTELICNTAVNRGIAVLFISHDIAVVHRIAGRIMVMHEGLIVEEADSGSIIAHPQAEYTKLLIACAKALDIGIKRER